jgi:hypothetical protein
MKIVRVYPDSVNFNLFNRLKYKLILYRTGTVPIQRYELLKKFTYSDYSKHLKLKNSTF